MAIRMQTNPIEAREARLEKVRQIAATLPDEKAISTVKTGRPHSGRIVVSLRLDPDIIEAFRATGKGWQARMNEALRKAMP